MFFSLSDVLGVLLQRGHVTVVSSALLVQPLRFNVLYGLTVPPGIFTSPAEYCQVEGMHKADSGRIPVWHLEAKIIN
jgi:hypothetical protein